MEYASAREFITALNLATHLSKLQAARWLFSLHKMAEPRTTANVGWCWWETLDKAVRQTLQKVQQNRGAVSKDHLSRYEDFHVKDKMVVRPSCLAHPGVQDKRQVSIYPSLGMRQLFGDVTMGQWRHN